MKTVLVPVDYSEASLKALEAALHVASLMQAELLLCHVYLPPVYVAEAYHPVYALPACETKQEALKKLRTFVQLVKEKSENMVPVKCSVVEGAVIEELLDLARSRKVSLIVMGTTGRSSVTNKLLGSTTRHLVKYASCPVLAVPEKASLSPVSRIVYATALDPGEVSALEQLSEAQRLLNASLTLLHIECGKIQVEVNVEVRKNELMKNLPKDDCTFSRMRSDNIAEGIEHFVESYNADLVAFTVSKRGFWKNLLKSSITARLLEELNLPMLAFPQYAAAAPDQLPDEKREVHPN